MICIVTELSLCVFSDYHWNDAHYYFNTHFDKYVSFIFIFVAVGNLSEQCCKNDAIVGPVGGSVLCCGHGALTFTHCYVVLFKCACM